MAKPNLVGLRGKASLLRLATKGRVKNVRSSNLAFFPEIGVLFNRIKKSGNTSLVLFFHALSGSMMTTGTDPEEVKHQRSVRQAALKDILYANQYRTFVCLRNPYERVISGFVEKVGQAYHPRFKNYPGYGNPTKASFESFLKHLLDLDWSEMDPHFWPQSRLVFQDLKHFDCIARLDTLRHDMGHFLSDLGLDPAEANCLTAPHPLEMSQPGKITKAALRSELLSVNARRYIEELYQVDFESFSF